MRPQKIIDSHIHLWPQSASNNASHGWMKEGEHLTRQFSVEDYLRASHVPDSDVDVEVDGFVYIETDRRVAEGDDVREWAAEPLKELGWLRRMVEGTPENGEGHASEHCRLVKGIVAWAPLDRGVEGFQDYLEAAREAAGEETFDRIRGFRYLLQGIHDEAKFKTLVASDGFIQTLKCFMKDGNDFTFDIGVDQHSGGVWQLEMAAEMMEKVHSGERSEEKVTFILNHLCKPELEHFPETADQIEAFSRWKACMKRFSKLEKVYMKLSGVFSELGNQDPETPLSEKEVYQRINPWLDVVFDSFTPQRIMFGSDWPVCNAGGPGDEKSWRSWRSTVAYALDAYKLSDEDEARIWHGTCEEAYNLVE
ncbi:hypothetical protein K402DRAFT_351794 [Aulographum hederae CBS 113979]|uniref:Amidohydrolase-related domain-containing protein n=1 Tax=Aulographum hederae CBS 113979 TaxID=1176131 RepID=A0A6G1H678_9PEZI|nr:hypothetical protein K402DRAFT_351794 [Aulographum hederae CBS 113979]